MTMRALIGLFLLNAGFLVVGTTIIWAAGGIVRRGELVRLAGVAYLVGLAAVVSCWVLELVVGIPFGLPAIVGTAVALAIAALVTGRRLGRGSPTLTEVAPKQSHLAIVAALGIALLAIFLEALFRVARLHGLYAFDGWAFWVPKGKAIYYFNGLDEQIFTSLPGPTYPPFVPALDASAFHAMGGVDTVTLHVQYWFIAVGFAAAIAGLLSERVRAWVLWPPLVLVVVVPRLSEHLVVPQADFALQALVTAAVVLVAIWLVEQRQWQLTLATVLLAGGVLVKREGVLLAVCLYVAAAVASWSRWRTLVPRLALSAVLVGAIGIPWRIWYATHGIGGETPLTSGIGGVTDRGPDSLHLSFDVLFDTGLWSIVPTIGIAAIVLAAIWGVRTHALFGGVLLASLVLGGVWATASTGVPVTANEALNPIVRYTAAAVLALGCLTPLLLEGVWRGRARVELPE
jgi:hypothetical protein